MKKLISMLLIALMVVCVCGCGVTIEDNNGADNYELALNGDSLGFEGLLKVAEKYSGTAAGKLANAYAGLSYAQLGQYEDAVKYLEDYDSCDDLMVSNAAIAALGNCYAQLGQNEKAASTLLKAAKRATMRYLEKTKGQGWWGSESYSDYYEELEGTNNPFNWIKLGRRLRKEAPDMILMKYWKK